MIIDDHGFLIPNLDTRKSFRCKPLEDIDANNYVLFAGTSHTEGVGVDVEQSYPYLVAEHFNYDYFNLSIGGTGTDVIEHNLLNWSYLFRDHQPQYVFIEWPPEQRYAAKYPGYENFLPVGAWEDVDKNVLDLLITGKKIFDTRLKLLYNLSKLLFKCPIIDIRYGSLITDNVDNSNMIWLQKIDAGTDGDHSGPESHKETAKKIIEYILTR